MARLYQITRLYVICLADIHVVYGTGQAQILLVISTIRAGLFDNGVPENIIVYHHFPLSH